jgi:Integrase core domain
MANVLTNHVATLDVFQRRVASMGIGEVVSAPSSPWQNPYAERLIGSIRRECLNHVIVLGEHHLRRLLTAYLTYYLGARTHLALEKDAPTPRRVQAPTEGRAVAFPEVGGLHHRYERRAAWRERSTAESMLTSVSVSNLYVGVTRRCKVAFLKGSAQDVAAMSTRRFVATS